MPWLGTMPEQSAISEIVVPALPKSLEAVHQLLDAFFASAQWRESERPDRTWQDSLRTAVLEICENVIHHAYRGRDSAGTLSLTLQRRGDRVEACLSDEGIEFVEPPHVGKINPDDVANLPEGGFGLNLARASVDELSYRRTPTGLNRWVLVKKLPVT
jgi:anti-sigma regulatory factor (Ser/Thr protein kinase)